MIKHGSKMIQALANATVPQITIQCGASFGAGNYGMCGRGFHPRFVFSWPTAKTAVMGAEQAAGTMAIVMREGAARKGEPVDEAKLAALKAKIVATFERQSERLPHLGPPARRRRHRPARHAPRARAVPRRLRRGGAAHTAAHAVRRRPALSARHSRRDPCSSPTNTKRSRRTLKRFIDEEINPHVDEWEAAEEFPAHEVFKQLGELGLLGLTKPEKYGGMGLDYSLLGGDGRGARPRRTAAACRWRSACRPTWHAGAGALRLRRAAPRVPRAGDRRRRGRLHRRLRARRGLRRRVDQDHAREGRRRLRHQRRQDVDHQRPAGRLDVPARQHRRRARRTRTSA